MTNETTTTTTVAPPEVRALVRCPTEERFALLVKYLGSEHRGKVALAMRILMDSGSVVVPMLIREAFARRRRPAHAVRLLEVVGAIGRPVSVSDWMTLYSAGGSRDPSVRAKCAELIVRVGGAVPDRH